MIRQNTDFKNKRKKCKNKIQIQILIESLKKPPAVFTSSDCSKRNREPPVFLSVGAAQAHAVNIEADGADEEK